MGKDGAVCPILVAKPEYDVSEEGLNIKLYNTPVLQASNCGQKDEMDEGLNALSKMIVICG